MIHQRFILPIMQYCELDHFSKSKVGINLLKFYCYTIWYKILMGKIYTNFKCLMCTILTYCPGAINSVSVWGSFNIAYRQWA